MADESFSDAPVREGGWTKESPSVGKTKRKNDDISFEVEDERLRQDHDEHFIDNIPDIEDLQEEELVTQIAAPPSISVNQITTYKDLDNDLIKHSHLNFMEEDVDLKLLAKVLLPESAVQEEDTVWQWDKLFAELSNDIKETWRVGKGVSVNSESPIPSSPPQ